MGTGTEFPWAQVIQNGLLVILAIMTWLNNRQGKQTHLSVNSMKDELVRTTAIASRAEGFIAGKVAGVVEQKEQEKEKEKEKEEGTP